MTDGDIKKEILLFLAKVNKNKGADKRSNLIDFADELGVDIDKFSQYLKELYDLFLIDIHTLPAYFSVSITSKGLNYLADSDNL